MNTATNQALALLVLNRGTATVVDAIIHFGREAKSHRQWQNMFHQLVRGGLVRVKRRGQLGSAGGPTIYEPTPKLRAIASSMPTPERMAAAFAVPVSIYRSRPPAGGRYYLVPKGELVDPGQIPETDLCHMEANRVWIGPVPEEVGA